MNFHLKLLPTNDSPPQTKIADLIHVITIFKYRQGIYDVTFSPKQAICHGLFANLTLHFLINVQLFERGERSM